MKLTRKGEEKYGREGGKGGDSLAAVLHWPKYKRRLWGMRKINLLVELKGCSDTANPVMDLKGQL